VKRSLLCLLSIGCAVLAQAGIAGAAPRPGLARSYGSGGVADIAVPSSEVATVAWAAAADGSAYVMRGQWHCASGCNRTLTVVRYGPQGEPDQAFGGGSGSIALADVQSVSGSPGLTVDAGGRLLATWWDGSDTVVARFDPSGAPDLSFGSGGQVRLPCQCGAFVQETGLTLLPGGKLLLHLGGSSPVGRGSGRLMLWRLLPDGSLDPTFGEGGGTALDYPFNATPGLFAARRDGSVLLVGGQACCQASDSPTLSLLDAGGSIVRGFTANAEHSLRALPAGVEGVVVSSAISRPNGTIDLLGRGAPGFQLRLRPDGRRRRSFGRRGVRRLGWPVATAARDAAGGVFAISDDLTAHRLYPDGKLDRRFGGRAGVSVGGVPIREGIEVATLAGGRALAFVSGAPECRYGGCTQQPRLVMFQEPSLQGRR